MKKTIFVLLPALALAVPAAYGDTPSPTITSTLTATSTSTVTPTGTSTTTPTPRPTKTPYAYRTPTRTATAAFTSAPTGAKTPYPYKTPTPTRTGTPAKTKTPYPVKTPTPTKTATPSSGVLLSMTNGHPPADWVVYTNEGPDGVSTFSCNGGVAYLGVTASSEDHFGYGPWITTDTSWDINNGTITEQFTVADALSDTNTTFDFSLLDDGTGGNSAFYAAYSYMDGTWEIGLPGTAYFECPLAANDVVKIVLTKNTGPGQPTLWEFFVNGVSKGNGNSGLTTGGAAFDVLRPTDGFSNFNFSNLTITQGIIAPTTTPTPNKTLTPYAYKTPTRTPTPKAKATKTPYVYRTQTPTTTPTPTITTTSTRTATATATP